MKDALKILAVVLLVLITISLISWAGWAISVATSGPRGQGDAIKQKNSAQNWTSAQAGFEDKYQAIKSADRKISIHKEALKADPKDPTLQTNLTGVTAVCVSAVADYNADSRKYLQEEFKSADLPYQIDSTDPTTDCK